ncbi:MAG: glycosyltransferase [Tannerellaceae bacterium]|nr:glycosyltransferase [Tannerellaceae bacterium]
MEELSITNRASVIISVYKNIESLEIVLLALAQQTVNSFEVIISEDNNSAKMADFISQARKRFSFPIKHIFQEDAGFRKNVALNKSIVASECDYLVFLDGDCIPHKKLVESYLTYLTPDTVCIGRRCLIGKSLTQKIYQTKNLKLLSVLNVLLHVEHLERAFHIPAFISKPYPFRREKGAIFGCNWGVYKQNILDINGYDEDYVLPSIGEDTDLEWRLRALKQFKFLNLKRQAIVYHLDHPFTYSEVETYKGIDKMNEKMKEGMYICKNGINKYLSGKH